MKSVMNSADAMAMNVSVQLTLQNGMHTEGTLFRIRKGWKLQFLIGASLQGKILRLFTNYPIDEKTNFLRANYRELNIENPTENANDSFDNYAELATTHSGAFEFFFTIDGSTKRSHAAGEGYFIVDPLFSPGSGGKTWELDGVVVQTYLAKNLGCMADWWPRLEVTHQSGYNMIHFTPLQELGYSKSCYSLRDHLKVNPWFSSPGGPEIGWKEIADVVARLELEWGVLSMTDLVYNHAASDGPWLMDHPEATYNLVTAPHLRPAFLLDSIIWQLSLDTSRGKYTSEGLPPEITHEGHLEVVKIILEREISKYDIHAFFMTNVEKQVDAFAKYLATPDPSRIAVPVPDNLVLQCNKYTRYGATVDMVLAARLFFDHHGNLSRACEDLRHRLCLLNDSARFQTGDHLRQAVVNVLANGRYRFLEGGGPRVKKVTPTDPIMWNYFKQPDGYELDKAEVLMDSDKACFVMAYNGWVMSDDPLRNFAESGSNVYLRRELIVWGDSVKLRYGAKPEDSPYIWARMTEYTELTARLFQAVRLDNCHGTPLHVAQYMLDKARAVRNNLYIVAELFTGSEHVDNIFINKLGINSLIREAQSACDSHEEGRLIHRYGGLPVGSFMQAPVRKILPSVAHALFYDLTHDNESPVCKRSAEDLLPSGAIVAMACCAIGSTRGYDELVPHYIDVVNEERVYGKWGVEVKQHTGILAAKAALNRLHQRLAKENYTEVYVDQLDADVVAVTRRCPQTNTSVIMVAHTAFRDPGPYPQHRHPSPLEVPGRVTKVLLQAGCKRSRDEPTFKQHPDYINGLVWLSSEAKEDCPGEMVRIIRGEGHSDTLEFVDFPPGSVVAVQVSLDEKPMQAIDSIHKCLMTQFSYRMRATSRGQLLLKEDLESLLDGEESRPAMEKLTLRQIASQLDLTDLNIILFRCGPEENADNPGNGTYEIPGYKHLVYCGFQGIMSELNSIRAKNDLGHPICSNLREGDWMPQYLVNRLMRYPDNICLVGRWLADVMKHLTDVPRYLIPCYFDAVITAVYNLFINEVWKQLGDAVVDGSSLVRSLSLGSVQFAGVGANVDLGTLLSPRAPEIKANEVPSISAGFPHFAEGVFRSWGRDTFIALRGILQLHHRNEESRDIILGYAGVLRHGLIPNLLGCFSGRQARYNCRDAVWWWLASIQAHCQRFPEDDLLKETVRRVFPRDDSSGEPDGYLEESLEETVMEALQRHVDGIDFYERHAGCAIDEHMTREGFRVTAGIDMKTGFPLGGNSANCGTWMDKMGSSVEAGNRGVPATPRDGSAVELVGLCGHTLLWLAQLGSAFPYPGVKVPGGGIMTWTEWADKIKKSFEPAFLIPSDTKDSTLRYNRGIYRDTVGSSAGFTDNQFRPNFLVALTLVPDFVTPSKAWFALNRVEDELLGPLGIHTLNPNDWAYRGNYDNANSSNDFTVARGFNYHQGPEWLWLVGYFFRARLHFSKVMASKGAKQHKNIVQETVNKMIAMLARHNEAIENSDWKSLPELTNENGSANHRAGEPDLNYLLNEVRELREHEKDISLLRVEVASLKSKLNQDNAGRETRQVAIPELTPKQKAEKHFKQFTESFNELCSQENSNPNPRDRVPTSREFEELKQRERTSRHKALEAEKVISEYKRKAEESEKLQSLLDHAKTTERDLLRQITDLKDMNKQSDCKDELDKLKSRLLQATTERDAAVIEMSKIQTESDKKLSEAREEVEHQKQQSETYKNDFEQERQEREKACSELDSLKNHHQYGRQGAHAWTAENSSINETNRRKWFCEKCSKENIGGASCYHCNARRLNY